MRARDEIRQDGHQIAGTVRHAATLDLKPCDTTVNRLPLVYKTRRRPPSRGGNPRTTTRSSTLTQDIGICLFINSQGLGGFSSSPALLVAPLYEHHGALQYNATSAPLLDVRPTTGTRINLVSHCCLAPTIERPISAHLVVSVRTTFRTDSWRAR
jgi:hypothetical protein